MSHFAKSALLGLGLVVGVAAAAAAQSNNLASLPPADAVAPATVAPNTNYPGPNPGKGWYNSSERQTQAVQPSAAYPGPKAGNGWYSQAEQTHPVEASPQYIGPRPN